MTICITMFPLTDNKGQFLNTLIRKEKKHATVQQLTLSVID